MKSDDSWVLIFLSLCFILLGIATFTYLPSYALSKKPHSENYALPDVNSAPMEAQLDLTAKAEPAEMHEPQAPRRFDPLDLLREDDDALPPLPEEEVDQ